MLLALAFASSADASITVAYDAQRPALRVDAQGYAEVSWTAAGARRYLLVPPRGRVFPGRRLPGPDVSRPTSSFQLPFGRVLRRTADGRFWALQAWRVVKGGPLELHFSRWRGTPTELELESARSGGDEVLQGRALFQGRPVSGFSPTPEGKQLRLYAFVDCFRCAAGPTGWTRIIGVAPRRDGRFRLFVRPAWRARRYRATIAGPNRGATLAPDASAVAASALR